MEMGWQLKGAEGFKSGRNLGTSEWEGLPEGKGTGHGLTLHWWVSGQVGVPPLRASLSFKRQGGHERAAQGA